MRCFSFILFCLVVSCSHRVDRRFASYQEDYRFGEADRKLSQVSILAPEKRGEEKQLQHLYLQLKDADHQYVDVDLSRITIRSSTNQKVEFSFERLVTGRYYLLMDDAVLLKHVDVLLDGKPLKEKLNLSLRRADIVNSKMRIVKNTNNELVIELKLVDKNKKPLDVSDRPEIVLDGMGLIDRLHYVKAGVWRFSVIYPDQNQLMYFSVRVHGVTLDRILRYQHVEK